MEPSGLVGRTVGGWVVIALGVAPLAAAAARGRMDGAAPPEPPRAWVDTTMVPPSGATVLVRAGADLQAAIDAAQPGDVLALEPGATFTGPFVLRAKPGNQWITLRPALNDEHLPSAGTRVDPSFAKMMPKLEWGTGPVVAAEPGAHHYRFIGIEIRPRAGTFLYNLVTLGVDEPSMAALPHHVIFDRCYLHGDPVKGSRRGIAMNAWQSAVVDSYLSDFKEEGADSQAIGGWNGPGPFKITGNYLEAAGENVMFGWADPSIPELVPSDIEVRGNHFAKPLGWKSGEPGYEGTAWTVKNLFELKNARRVLVDGNLFEYGWAQAQNGFAILFTVRNQDGGAPWSVVEDVTFSNNEVRHAGAAVNVLGRDDLHPSRQAARLAIRNNLFEDIGGDRWGGNGTLLQILNGSTDVVFDHNTALQTGHMVFAEGQPHTRFVFTNDIAPHNELGMVGTGTAPGRQTLTTYFPGATVVRNVIAGGHAELYPPQNFFPASLGEVGFEDPARGDFRLRPVSPYRGAGTDGQDIGVVFSEFMAAGRPARSFRSPRVATPAGKGADGARPWARLPFRLWRTPVATMAVGLCGLLVAYAWLGHPRHGRPWRRGEAER